MTNLATLYTFIKACAIVFAFGIVLGLVERIGT